jgi:hypothetical protein
MFPGSKSIFSGSKPALVFQGESWYTVPERRQHLVATRLRLQPVGRILALSGIARSYHRYAARSAAAQCKASVMCLALVSTQSMPE